MRKTLFAFLTLFVLTLTAAIAGAVTCGQDTGYGGADANRSCQYGTCTGTDVCRWNPSTNVCGCVPINRDCERGSAGTGLCAVPPSDIGGNCAPRGNGFRCE